VTPRPAPRRGAAKGRPRVRVEGRLRAVRSAVLVELRPVTRRDSVVSRSRVVTRCSNC